ncbi:MAG: peptidoglycan-binding domain-containing protein, partial [Minisyncoccia bacterium]
VVNTTSGTSVQARVNNLLGMGNKKVADELMKQYPNIFTNNNTITQTISEIQKVTKDLKLGMRNNDVKTLQLFLISQNKGPAAKALAKNGATNYFGKLTRSALAEWQKENKITPSAGYFGKVTRAKIKLLNL